MKKIAKILSVVLTLAMVFSLVTVSLTSYAEGEKAAEDLVIDVGTLAGAAANYAPHGYGDRKLVMFGYGTVVSLGNIDLSKYDACVITYATDLNYPAYQAGMTAQAMWALKSNNVSIGYVNVGPNWEGILGKGDVITAGGWYKPNTAGANWDIGERTAVIDLTDQDYSGEVFLSHFNSTGNEALLVGVKFLSRINIVNFDDYDNAYGMSVDGWWWNNNLLQIPEQGLAGRSMLDYFARNDVMDCYNYGGVTTGWNGWVAFRQKVKCFGYMLNGNLYLNDKFTVANEPGLAEVVESWDGWAGSGETIQRFNISIPLMDCQLATDIVAVAYLEDGTVVRLNSEKPHNRNTEFIGMFATSRESYSEGVGASGISTGWWLNPFGADAVSEIKFKATLPFTGFETFLYTPAAGVTVHFTLLNSNDKVVWEGDLFTAGDRNVFVPFGEAFAKGTYTLRIDGTKNEVVEGSYCVIASANALDGKTISIKGGGTDNNTLAVPYFKTVIGNDVRTSVDRVYVDGDTLGAETPDLAGSKDITIVAGQKINILGWAAKLGTGLNRVYWQYIEGEGQSFNEDALIITAPCSDEYRTRYDIAAVYGEFQTKNLSKSGFGKDDNMMELIGVDKLAAGKYTVRIVAEFEDGSTKVVKTKFKLTVKPGRDFNTSVDNLSFDQILVNNKEIANGTNAVNEAKKLLDYSKGAADTITLYGWFGNKNVPTAQYGYSIDGGDPYYDDSFKFETTPEEQAAIEGVNPNGYRFKITVDTEEAQINDGLVHEIRALARLTDGTVVLLNRFEAATETTAEKDRDIYVNYKGPATVIVVVDEVVTEVIPEAVSQVGYHNDEFGSLVVTTAADATDPWVSVPLNNVDTSVYSSFTIFYMLDGQMHGNKIYLRDTEKNTNYAPTEGTWHDPDMDPNAVAKDFDINIDFPLMSGTKLTGIRIVGAAAGQELRIDSIVFHKVGTANRSLDKLTATGNEGNLNTATKISIDKGGKITILGWAARYGANLTKVYWTLDGAEKECSDVYRERKDVAAAFKLDEKYAKKAGFGLDDNYMELLGVDELRPGTYEVAIMARFDAGEDFEIDKFTLTVNSTTETSVSAKVEDGKFVVTVTGDFGEKDWVGIYKEGENPEETASILYFYVGENGGTFTLPVEGMTANRLAEILDADGNLVPGNFVVYLFANDGYTTVDNTQGVAVTVQAPANPQTENAKTGDAAVIAVAAVLVLAVGAAVVLKKKKAF